MAEQETQEQEEHTFSLPLFTFPLDTQKELKRKDITAKPNTYTMYSALSAIRELLLHIEDYELVRKVCQVEPGKKGLNDLYMGIQTGVPCYYDAKKPEEYAAFLTRLEQLTLQYLTYVHNPTFYYAFHSSLLPANGTHPRSLLVYALALGALGEEASYYAMNVLEYYQYYRVKVEGLPWVRSQLSSYTRYGRRYDLPSLTSDS